MDFAYVIVDPDDAGIASMAWLSIQSLRRHHPDASVWIWTDLQSADTLIKYGWRQFGDCNVCVVDANGESPMMRSRWIKCRVMQKMDRDFIFLDCDTLVLGDLSALIELDSEFAAAMDSNKPVQPLVRETGLRDYFAKMSWPIGDVPDLNSGVWLARRSERVKKMGEQWPKLWAIGIESGGVQDQPSFWAALYSADIRITVLDPIWNALVIHKPYLLRRAKIAHFWRSTSMGGTILEDLVKSAHQYGKVNWPMLDHAVRIGSPWKVDAEPWQYLRSRHYFRAVKAKLHLRRSSLASCGK